MSHLWLRTSSKILSSVSQRPVFFFSLFSCFSYMCRHMLAPAGFFMSALTAISGPCIEIVLINYFHLYQYSEQQIFGIPFWISAVYFCGGPAVGNLGRAVFQSLQRQQEQEPWQLEDLPMGINNTFCFMNQLTPGLSVSVEVFASSFLASWSANILTYSYDHSWKRMHRLINTPVRVWTVNVLRSCCNNCARNYRIWTMYCVCLTVSIFCRH